MSANRPARTREEWLKAAVNKMRPLFKAHGRTLPKDLRISIGFGPTGARQENKIILGVCCARALSEDGVNEIFISPEDADAMTMLATVAHEVIHAMDNCESGHKGWFKVYAEEIGLAGPMTATTAGEDLAKVLEAMAADLGPYPGGRMNLMGGRPTFPEGPEGEGGPITSGPKKQGTRMIKRECQQDPGSECFGYSVRLTQKWLEVGNPVCPMGHEMHS